VGSFACIGIVLGWMATSYSFTVSSSAYLQHTGDVEYAAAR
jgi:hypothetical protein